jgi:hypothetical protein
MISNLGVFLHYNNTLFLVLIWFNFFPDKSAHDGGSMIKEANIPYIVGTTICTKSDKTDD